MRFVPTIALLVLFAACAKDPGGVNPQNIQLAVIAGNQQSDTVARQLATAIVARADDQVSAQAAPGIVINWFRANQIPGDRVLSHADSVQWADTTFLGAAITDAAGTARIRPNLSTKAGGQVVLAFALDEQGNRAVHAAATLMAIADRATHTLGARNANDTVLVTVGAPVIASISYAAAYDQYGNYAGPMYWVAAAGWTVSADTCWATQAGITDMQQVRDGIYAHVVLKAVP